MDESYFGARRVRGKRGRAARRKTIVFGIFKRNGYVYRQVVPGCRRRTLLAVIRGRVSPDAVVHGDGRCGYDELVDVGYVRHFRINHGRNEVARVQRTSTAPKVPGALPSVVRLQKFNGIPARTFYMHLKECEYKFNNRNKELNKLLLKLRENTHSRSSPG